MKKRILGVKGFDKNFKCKGFQYEVGSTFEQESKPSLCNTGFHFSPTLEDCFKFYPNKNGNKYCLVEALGETEEGIDKSCTNKIKIIKQIKPSSKFAFSPEMLKELCNDGFVIGGSTALRIHGYTINRNSKEVDLIISTENYEKIKDKCFAGYKKVNRFSGMDSVKCYIGIFGEKYDIIIQEEIEPVTRNVDGYELKVQDEDAIWHHKLKYALNGVIKHIDDIRSCGISFVRKPQSKSCENDYLELPF